MSKNKRQRILTVRPNPFTPDNPKSFEGIEVEVYNGRDYLYLCDQDGSCPTCVEHVQEYLRSKADNTSSQVKRFV